MPPKRDKLSLFLFIDAFGWTIKQRHPSFLEGLIRDSRPLETVLGYSSACDPSIISGRMPAEHGLWSSFYYDPDNSPFKWTRPLRLLPDALVHRARVRHQLGRWIRRRCGFTGYFNLYNVPFDRLHLFNYAEKRRIWTPGGLPCGESIFDTLAAHSIPCHVHDSALPDAARLDRLGADILNRRIDFAYSSLGRLDALMHAVGTDHPDIGRLLKWYDGRIRALLDAAEANYREVAWYCFSDHGMHNVTAQCDLVGAVEQLGLEWNRDYAAFYDATMARFWLLNPRARDPLLQLLENQPQGRILNEEELRSCGTWFADGRYGDLIFVMHPGVQIVPSFMGRKASAGMHGYDPADPGSAASISSGQPIPASITHIRHIHQLMLNELGIRNA